MIAIAICNAIQTNRTNKTLFSVSYFVLFLRNTYVLQQSAKICYTDCLLCSHLVIFCSHLASSCPQAGIASEMLSYELHNWELRLPN